MATAIRGLVCNQTTTIATWWAMGIWVIDTVCIMKASLLMLYSAVITTVRRMKITPKRRILFRTQRPTRMISSLSSTMFPKRKSRTSNHSKNMTVCCSLAVKTTLISYRTQRTTWRRISCKMEGESNHWLMKTWNRSTLIMFPWLVNEEGLDRKWANRCIWTMDMAALMECLASEGGSATPTKKKI